MERPLTYVDPLLEPRFVRRLESLAIRLRRIARSAAPGEHASRAVGSGVAFAGHRPYAPGDDLRLLDWKLLARSDRLYLRQHEEGRELALSLVLDCSGSMTTGTGAKLRYAKQLAAALGYVALVALDRVSVQAYAEAPRARLGPLRGRARAPLLLQHLAALPGGGGTALREAVQAVCAASPRGGLACVLSDGLDPDLLGALERLRKGGFAPVLLRVVDPDDASPTLLGELTLVDAETGAHETVIVTERILAHYRTAYRAEERRLEGALRDRRIPHFPLPITLPLEHAVLGVLRRGGVVG